MVLLLANSNDPIGRQQLRSPKAVLSTLLSCPALAESAQKFAASGAEGAAAGAGTSGITLYLYQRESAFVHQSDPVVSFLASDDATTCHLVALRQPATGSVMLCHFDGVGPDSLVRLADSRFYGGTAVEIAEASAKAAAAPVVELHLVGGFVDSRGESARVSQALLNAFNNSKCLYRLVTACVCDANTVVRDGQPHPAVTGVTVAVSAASDQFLAPANIPLEMRGPWQPLRHLRFLCHEDAVHEVYDPERHCLVLEPFDYSCSGLSAEYADAPDSILARMSTSPHQEPAHFVSCLRHSLRFARAFNRPERQVFHLGAIVERPLADGTWEHVSGADEKHVKL